MSRYCRLGFHTFILAGCRFPVDYCEWGARHTDGIDRGTTPSNRRGLRTAGSGEDDGLRARGVASRRGTATDVVRTDLFSDPEYTDAEMRTVYTDLF